MNGNLQTRLNPPTSPFAGISKGIDTSKTSAPAIDRGGTGEKIDFVNLLGSSNVDLKEERKAKKKGDLAGKTDQEILDRDAKQTDKTKIPKNQLDKDDFLKLFIAQLQNQDPLKPKEDTEMAAQMAQFNGLEQMLNLNKKFEDLVSIQKQGQAVSLIDYVGKEIIVDGGRGFLHNGKFNDVKFVADQPLTEAKLTLRDTSGTVISEQDIGDILAGEHEITNEIKGKDGENVSSGIYTISVTGKSAQNEMVALPISTRVKVKGIDIKGGGGSFNTDLGKVTLEEITSVEVQGAKPELKKPETPTGSAEPETIGSQTNANETNAVNEAKKVPKELSAISPKDTAPTQTEAVPKNPTSQATSAKETPLSPQKTEEPNTIHNSQETSPFLNTALHRNPYLKNIGPR